MKHQLFLLFILALGLTAVPARAQMLFWTKIYGGQKDEFPQTMAILPDRSVVVAATKTSFGSGYEDIWLVKLDMAGDTV